MYMRFKRAAMLGIFVCVPLLLDSGVWAQEGIKFPWATPQELGGTERYLTHLSTDKPIYREGETVFIRGVVLHATSRSPIPTGSVNANVQILGPKGETIVSGHSRGHDSVVSTSWQVPADASGGEYKVKITYPHDGQPPAERGFEVRAYRPPRLNSQIVFLRDGYGPGDEVSASVQVTRAEGGAPKAAKVTVAALVDGKEIHRSTTKLDSRGSATAAFKLPEKLGAGDGTLAFIIEDGGVVETASKTIPIVLDNFQITFYPEGGTLIDGLENRVYVQARAPSGKPADIEGIVVDDQGRQVAQVRTLHEGRGHFVFTPQNARKYHLNITKPSGLTRKRPLPEGSSKGAILRALDEVSPAGKPVRLGLAAMEHSRVQLVLAQKDKILVNRLVQISKAQRTHALDIDAAVAGVLTATVFDEGGAPLAERLLFRAPREPLQIQVEPKSVRTTPGSPMELTVRTLLNGKPHPALVGLTVTDESVFELKDKRDQAPRLPVMVFLDSEVKDLADAHVYLDPQHRQAKVAVDLLLGTQGWRRFAMVDARKFLAQHGDAARRVLAQMQPRPRPRVQRSFSSGMEDFAEAAPSSVRRAPSKPQSRSAPAPVRAPPPPAAAPAPVAPVLAQPAAPEKKKIAASGMAVPKGRSGLIWVREYAHQVAPQRKVGERTDFTETIYWNAGVRTDEQGVATVRFSISDSVTRFLVMADGFDAHGRLGSATKPIISVEPFYVEAKMPLHATAGDIIDLPINVINSTDAALSKGRITVQTPDGIQANGPQGSHLFAPDSRNRQMARLSVGKHIGPAEVTVSARGGNYSDKVTRTFEVEPAGFPMEIAAGGILDANGTVTVEIEIPKSAVPGSVVSEVAVYPAPLGSLTASLQGLMREPHGCFEQTSSTNYPLVMAQQYFKTHSGVDPQLIARSQDLLAKGYKRLRGFECKKQGYEWFGDDPGHEALSAYGLMQFTDMAKVMQVDTQMVNRTREFLLAKRDGNGGFTHERRALHTWLVQPDLHNGYITWALTETGAKGIDREVQSFKHAALQSKDSYVAALGANVALNTKDRQAAHTLMARLASMQTPDGWVDGSSTSIVGSRGNALKIETTALATLAWLREPRYAHAVEGAMRYLSGMAKGGRYGSTQSTVLALRAILAYDKAKQSARKSGSVTLLVNGRQVATAATFDAQTQSSVALPDIASLLSPGRHTLTLQQKGGQPLPYSVNIRYHARTPASSPECKLALQTTLRAQRIDEGATSQIDVKVTNKSSEVLPMPVAIIGVPGGMEVRHDQLAELKKADRISAYEVRGRDVVLYWRELGPKKTVTLPISVVAAIPGAYTGPASRVYQYYVDEHRQWVEGVRAEIAAR